MHCGMDFALDTNDIDELQSSIECVVKLAGGQYKPPSIQ